MLKNVRGVWWYLAYKGGENNPIAVRNCTFYNPIQSKGNEEEVDYCLQKVTIVKRNCPVVSCLSHSFISGIGSGPMANNDKEVIKVVSCDMIDQVKPMH